MSYDYDVIIAGAGPTGLTLANLLGLRGVRTLIIDERDSLIDYPRGVGLDDESFRTIQSMGLVDEVTPFTIPQHIMRLVDGNGDVIMTNDPQGKPFGWARKYGFLQPLVDRAIYEGLARFEHVTFAFNNRLSGITDLGDGVRVTVTTPDEERSYTAQYLVGCEGGRSFTRKWMGVDFEGKSPSTRWVVVDCNNDPLGFPNVYLGADPRRPYVSIGLPRGVRRFEFMLFDDEPSERVEDDAFVEKLLADHLPEGTELDIIRRRVFTHHGRIATDFRKGRVLIAGDAAHLMPVWMGQGFNSGLRDVTNLAWKLDLVIRGEAGEKLLDTYTVERKDHAKAMVDLSMALGSIIKPTNRQVTFARDRLAKVVNLVPSVREYFADMRFKPMPRYGRGAIVDQYTLAAGTASRRPGRVDLSRLIPTRVAVDKQSPVGSQFIQPIVEVAGQQLLLDDALGTGFAIISWGLDPARLFPADQLTRMAQLGVQLACAVSPTQVEWAREHCQENTLVISDVSDNALKNWFDKRCVGSVIVRPDHFTAAAFLNSDAPRAWSALAQATHLS